MPVDLAKDIRPVTEFRNRTAAFLKSLEKDRAVVLTRNGKAAAVLESVESYQKREEEVRFLRGLLAGARDAEAGRVEDGEAAFRRVKARLRKRT
jgi:prevent-host-death family protein